jgi:hypothetical protein
VSQDECDKYIQIIHQEIFYDTHRVFNDYLSTKLLGQQQQFKSHSYKLRVNLLTTEPIYFPSKIVYLTNNQCIIINIR